MLTDVDLVTIGAGGGAYPAGFRLARSGRKVLMTDPKGVLSGNCLAEGCVPSKTVREIAHHLWRHRQMASFGATGSLEARYEQIIDHKDRVQALRYAQHEEELKRSPNLTLLKGSTRILDPHTVLIETDRGTQRVSTGNILIASGSDIHRPPIPGAEHCLTSHDLFKVSPNLTRRPDSMTVIGGGYIGLETACMFSALGTRVTLLEQSPSVLPGTDPIVTDTLLPLLDPGIRILFNATVISVEKTSNGLQVRYLDGNGKEDFQESRSVLLATGRKPVLPEGIKEIGIETSPRGIVVNEALQTKHSHIYACGDVNGRTPLFHSALRQSLVAAHNIMAGNSPVDYMDHRSVPTTVFTLPAASWVGWLPEEARQQGIRLLETSYAFKEDSRAQILGETGGGIRLFFEPGTLRLMGGCVVGIDADHLIGEMGQAMAHGLTARDLATFADPHPMASEGIGKAARQLF